LIALAGLLIAVVRTGQAPKRRKLVFSEFMSDIAAGQVAEVTIAAMT